MKAKTLLLFLIIALLLSSCAGGYSVTDELDSPSGGRSEQKKDEGKEEKDKDGTCPRSACAG